MSSRTNKRFPSVQNRITPEQQSQNLFNSNNSIKKSNIKMRVPKKQSNGTFNGLSSNNNLSDKLLSSIQPDSDHHKQLDTIPTIDIFLNKLEQIFENSLEINQYIHQQSQKSSKINILKAKQLILDSINLIFCQYLINREQQIPNGQLIEKLLIRKIHKLCQRQLINHKCIQNQNTLSNMLDQRIKKLKQYKFR